MKFIGWRNYQKLFTTGDIMETILRTLRYAVIILPFTLLLGFSLGVMLSNKSKINVFFRTLLFAPHVTSMVAISSVWLFIFHPQYGALTTVLDSRIQAGVVSGYANTYADILLFSERSIQISRRYKPSLNILTYRQP